MNALLSRPTASIFVEVTEQSVILANESRALELPVERESNGALAAASADALRNALQMMGNPSSSAQVFCLLPARGVAVRRIGLPASTAEEIERLLPLQIEAHFPLSSEELAWGYTPLAASVPSREGTPLKELLVAAVKKDAVQSLREIISSAGFKPLFGIAALERRGLCAHAPAKFGVLEVGRSKSELLTLDESGPATLRVIAMGGEGDGSTAPLLDTLRNNGVVQKIFVSGKGAALWSARIAPNIPTEALEVSGGQSTAIAGLRETLRRGHEPLLIHACREGVRVQRAPTPYKWAAAAVILLIASFLLRYAEPALRRGQVTRAMSDIRAAKDKLPKVDRELAFLQFIQTNQPTYLEAISSLAASAPPGTTFDGLSINRRGDVSFRGKAQNGQQAASLRSKLIDSGFFANVVLDEQTPGQNQQVTFRMTAQLVPESERKPPKVAEKPAAAGPKGVSTNLPANAATNAVKTEAKP